MKPIAWRFIEFVSLLLEKEERMVVLGDLAESSEPFARALINVLTLAVRRQIELWRSWQPWLALFGIISLSGYALSGLVLILDSGFMIQTRTYLHYGVHYEMGVSATKDIAYLICALLSLLVWSWICGAVLGSLSGRSAWLRASLFYIVVAFSSPTAFALISRHAIPGYRLHLAGILFTLFFPRPAKMCFLVAAICGIVFGARKPMLTAGQVSTLALASFGATLLMLWTSGWYEDVKGIISNGAWPAVPWTKRMIPFLLMSWPVVYLLGTNRDLGRKLGIRNEY